MYECVSRPRRHLAQDQPVVDIPAIPCYDRANCVSVGLVFTTAEAAQTRGSLETTAGPRGCGWVCSASRQATSCSPSLGTLW